ncbi:hypothetical protein CALCODRAFT_485033 [Calocera cornea HHB12733]|uniref:VOC domain-containing protein n=1 Tax=Calocera cornea HHB12733 TaxID=1353952 RepID=A0A165ELB8_9BASI|nr:hypothetical protein CALCODRAFT_485033 [Calocera cornea HHB12733]
MSTAAQSSSNPHPNPQSEPEPEPAAAPFTLDRVDHIVLQCRSVERTLEWYSKYLCVPASPPLPSYGFQSHYPSFLAALSGLLAPHPHPPSPSPYLPRQPSSHSGMRPTPFATPTGPRDSLTFGQQKLNLHPAHAPYTPHAHAPLPGAQDLCFVLSPPATAELVLQYWLREGLDVLEGGGVVQRTGARGELRSVYTRDPDGNLIEVSNYV